MKNMTVNRSSTAQWSLRRGLGIAFWIVLVAGAATVWFCRVQARNLILAQGVMLNDAPTDDAIDEVINAAQDQQTVLRSLWDTGKIVHREAAIRRLAHLIPAGQAVPAEFESWVVGAAFDPDMDVQEVALGILREHKYSGLAAICVAQLRDCDPEVRLLALNSLKLAGADVGVPSVIPLLEDSDPRVVATALKLLENWTGGTFGVKLVDTAPTENKETGLMEFSDKGRAKAAGGAARAKMWWEEHQRDFPAVHLEAPPSLLTAAKPVPAGDFSISTLDGRRVSLSDLRGKVVLVNFWTTWCTACIGEMPVLVQLQKRHHEQLAILGVSLDGLPVDDDDDGPAGGRLSLNEIHNNVARTAKTRQINYTVLLDEKDKAGARFNGGELPTTVIVDAEGNVRRRFIGPRSLSVFETMIAEASRPLR
jgi:thiol-disulfide isomerase/thioredoxin